MNYACIMGLSNLGGVSIAWGNKDCFIKKGIGSPSISLQDDVDNTTRVLPKDSTYTGDPSLTLSSTPTPGTRRPVKVSSYPGSDFKTLALPTISSVKRTLYYRIL